MRKSTMLLLLVFAALAALSTVLRSGTRRSIAELEQARAELGDIHSAALAYLRSQGGDRELPTLGMLLDGGGESAGIPARDPWGNPYEIRPGRGAWPFEVISWGPDGDADTGDDLSSITR